jgi:non-specific protein-tyrosine kinase
MLLVHQAPGNGTSDYTAILASERLAETYAQMLRGRIVLEGVISLLGIQETPDTLAEKVEVKAIPETQLIQLSVEHSDPTQATLIANTIAETFITQIETLQEERYHEFLDGMREPIINFSELIERTQANIESLGTPTTDQKRAELMRLEGVLAGYSNTYATLQQEYEQMRMTAARAADTVILAEAAPVPKDPVRPRTLMNTALAAAVGTMLAIGGVFLTESLDNAIKTPKDVSQALGMNTLGAIGRLGKREGVIVAAQPLSPAAEAFRVLHTNIRYSSLDGHMRTLLVTSPRGGEGKSIAVANLAVTMAQAGLEVVAVDADLRHPRLHQLFDLDPRREGLTRALLEEGTDGLLQPTQVDGLVILTSGELPPNPARILGSQRMQELLIRLAQQVDVVLIDTSPVLPVADAALLAQGVDGVLLVLEAGNTRREAACHAAERLRQVGANLVGVVLNGVSVRKGSNYRYFQEYYGNGGGKRKHRPQTEQPTARETAAQETTAGQE